MSTVVLYCWCHRDSASVLLYFTTQGFVITLTQDLVINQKLQCTHIHVVSLQCLILMIFHICVVEVRNEIDSKSYHATPRSYGTTSHNLCKRIKELLISKQSKLLQ